MNLLPVEEIPKELQLTNDEIIKQRCELVEEQVKILIKEIDDLKQQNEKYRLHMQELYVMLQQISDSDCSSCDEVDTDTPITTFSPPNEDKCDNLNNSIIVQ